MDWLWRFLKGDEYLPPAVDIGSSAVKVVQSERSKNSYRVKKHGKKEYREQVFAGTEIIDEFELVSTLRNLLEELNVKDRKVSIHIPLHACFYNVLSIPATKEPEQAVMEYMQGIINPEEIPFVKIDYRILPVSIEKGHIDVAIAAVKKEVIEKRAKILSRAGLEPIIIDIEPAAINNQFYLNNPESTALPVCLVDIGAYFTKVVISFGGYPYTTRNIELGGAALTEHLQKEFMLSAEEAEALKRGGRVKEIPAEKVNEVIANFLKKIVTETLWTIDNFKDRFGLEVNNLYLYGGTAKIAGIEEMVRGLSGLKVERGSPLAFSGIPEHEEFAVAAGLSLRHKGDENAKV